MILVRHGQSHFNVTFSVTRVDPGIEDPALTELGFSQAQKVAAALSREPIRELITSPYTRALQTASVIAAALGVPVRIEPLVGERGAFACDVGTARDVLMGRWPQYIFDHMENEWWPSAESEERLLERCARFRATMAARHDWRSVAVVSHWGFIRGLTGLTLTNGEMVPFDPTV